MIHKEVVTGLSSATKGYLAWLALALSVLSIDTYLTVSFPSPYEDNHVFSDNGARFMFELLIILGLFSYFKAAIRPVELFIATFIACILCYLEVWDSCYFWVANGAESLFGWAWPSLPRYGVIIMFFVSMTALMTGIVGKGFSVLRVYCLIVMPAFAAFILFAHVIVAQPIIDRAFEKSSNEIKPLIASAHHLRERCFNENVICYSGKPQSDVLKYHLADLSLGDIQDIDSINTFAIEAENPTMKTWIRRMELDDELEDRNVIIGYLNLGDEVRIIIDNKTLREDREFAVNILAYLLMFFAAAWVIVGIGLMLMHQERLAAKERHIAGQSSYID